MPLDQFLQALGLEMPSPAYIVGLLVFGVVGYVGWRHGRREKLPVPKWIGVALMLYPYAVSDTWVLWFAGAVLTAALVFRWR